MGLFYINETGYCTVSLFSNSLVFIVFYDCLCDLKSTVKPQQNLKLIKKSPVEGPL